MAQWQSACLRNRRLQVRVLLRSIRVAFVSSLFVFFCIFSFSPVLLYSFGVYDAITSSSDLMAQWQSACLRNRRLQVRVLLRSSGRRAFPVVVYFCIAFFVTLFSWHPLCSNQTPSHILFTWPRARAYLIKGTRHCSADDGRCGQSGGFNFHLTPSRSIPVATVDAV
jgi:hypothetical protein